MIELLRLPVLKGSTGMSKSTLYERIAEGLFPKQVPLGGRIVAWPANEVAAVNAARIAGHTAAQIRELVSKLHAARRADHELFNPDG
jgi:prophage regulatory protein